MAITDPRDIPGLVLWLSAEAETSYANDAEMATWTDLSGNGNHATGGATDTSANGRRPLWQAASGPSAGPAVRFGLGGGGTGATGAYFSLPAAILSGAASGEVAATVKAEFDSTTQAGNWLKAGSSTGATHYPYQTTIYDDFGCTARKTVGTQAGLASWHRVAIWSAPNDYGYWFDGVSKYATASNTVGWATLPRLGNSGPPGATSNQTVDTWEGYLGAVVFYNRKLTATERADLDTWLAAHPSGGTAGALAPNVTLAGTAPAVTGSFDATATTPPVDVDLAGIAPGVTGSFALEEVGVVVADFAGAAPAVFGSFDLTASAGAIEAATDSANRLNGLSLVTEWDVSVEPPVVEPKRQKAHDYAVATSLPEPTLVDGRPT